MDFFQGYCEPMPLLTCMQPSDYLEHCMRVLVLHSSHQPGTLVIVGFAVVHGDVHGGPRDAERFVEGACRLFLLFINLRLS